MDPCRFEPSAHGVFHLYSLGPCYQGHSYLWLVPSPCQRLRLLSIALLTEGFGCHSWSYAKALRSVFPVRGPLGLHWAVGDDAPTMTSVRCIWGHLMRALVFSRVPVLLKPKKVISLLVNLFGHMASSPTVPPLRVRLDADEPDPRFGKAPWMPRVHPLGSFVSGHVWHVNYPLVFCVHCSLKQHSGNFHHDVAEVGPSPGRLYKEGVNQRYPQSLSP